MFIDNSKNVLLIENQQDQEGLITDLLNTKINSSYKIRYSRTDEETNQIINSNGLFNFDVVLLSYRFEKENDFNTIKILSDKKISIPVIVLIENSDFHKDPSLMKIATDFILMSDLSPSLLDRTMQYAIERKRVQRILIQQQQKAATLMNAKSLIEMTAILTHELNNPLSIIQGNSNLIQEALNKENFDIDKIRKQNDKNISMIKRIADIKKNFRIRCAELMAESYEPADIIPIIRDSIELCREHITKISAAVIFNPNKSLFVRCNPIEFSQVLVNLITNACEAVSQLPTRWIAIELEPYDSNVRIKITDSGQTIPRGIADKIFNKYFTTKSEGNGIGLNFSKKLIESYGGSLSLNLENPNTQFIIDLPTEATIKREKPYRFLVVDDEVDFADLICENLTAQGFYAEAENNPALALEKMNSNKYDAIVTDIFMPNMNGIELAAKIKENYGGKAPVFSFISGYATPHLKSVISEEHMGNVFEKPFDFNEFISTTLGAIRASETDHKDQPV